MKQEEELWMNKSSSPSCGSQFRGHESVDPYQSEVIRFVAAKMETMCCKSSLHFFFYTLFLLFESSSSPGRQSNIQ